MQRPDSGSTQSKRNKTLQVYEDRILQRSQKKKVETLEATNRKGDPNHFYDDDIVTETSNELSDRITVVPILGDAVRFFGGLLRRRSQLTAEEFIQKGLDMLFTEDVYRKDVAKLTGISRVQSNLVVPFMNGGPAGENWDNSPNGFFDWISNKSSDSILGVELGFKADDYGLDVANRLIQKKKSSPNMYIGILIDGFVSILMQKPPETVQQFEQDTQTMIENMSLSGIDVIVNSSFDPGSRDFLAANHIKLWVFDGKAAFFGGIGIETQFRTRMYDEMDLVSGRFVNVLTLMALLLIKNQRAYDNPLLGLRKDLPLTRDDVVNRFIRKPGTEGNVQMEIAMDVPGYVQDARNEYVRLLQRKDISEIHIIAPYFSDHKVARALIRTADLLYQKFKEENNKRIHVVFPKKQEDAIIADVSKYYAHYLRSNPVVETLQYTVQMQDQTFNMLHAKQMVLVLEDKSRNWNQVRQVRGKLQPGWKSAKHVGAERGANSRDLG